MSQLLLGQCVHNSVGTVNAIMGLLWQSLLVSQCGISPNSMWPPDYGANVLKTGLIEEEYDYVVIGAGSAGSVLGAELSNNPKRKVLVLEEGKNPPQEEQIPKLLLSLQDSEYCHNVLIESNGYSCKASKNGQCMSARGKVLGGSGAINGMLYVRGNRQDYDGWQALGNKGWGYKDVMTIFQNLEQPNHQGYVHLEHFPQYADDVGQLITAGGQELGIPQVEDFVEPSLIGYSRIRGTIQNGRRASSAKTFLSLVKNRQNLRVMKEAKVDKLLFNDKGTQVVGVQFKLQDKKIFTVKAKKEFILSAGAIGSPEILMRSGVGPRQLLESLNISVVHELPVGDNLQDHVLAAFFIGLDSRRDNLTDAAITSQLYEYLEHSSGPFSTIGLTSLVGFIDTGTGAGAKKSKLKKNKPTPNLELNHFLFSKGDLLGMTAFTKAFKMNTRMALHLLTAIRKQDILIVYALCLHPKSRGVVRLASASPSTASIISANYLAEPEDVQTLVAGANFVKNLLNTAPLQASNAQLMHIPIKECDVYKFMSDQYWQCYVSYYTMSGYHYAGTVKMGPKRDKTACLNAQLKVKGVDNLRVADASIMPLITSGNTNAPAIMIAKKAADMIVDTWKKYV